jgi:hypothetical protein
MSAPIYPGSGISFPVAFQHKQVTSLEKELAGPVEMEEVKSAWRSGFEEVFRCEVV